jgi:hypothetical protein
MSDDVGDSNGGVNDPVDVIIDKLLRYVYSCRVSDYA